MTTKFCRACLIEHPITDFYQDSKGGLRPRCKKAVIAENKAWKKAHPEQHRAMAAAAARRANVKRRFGLSEAEYDQIMSTIGGVCHICGKLESRDRAMSLDHDHVTGRIRGALCSRCNLLIGNAGDDPDLLERAAKYLSLHRKGEAAVA